MKSNNWKYTLLRVLLFCVCTVIILILSDTFTKGLSKPQSGIIQGILAVIATFGITIPFARWEKLTLVEIGVLPHRRTIGLFAFGLVIGLVLSLTHALVVVYLTQSKLILVPSLSTSSILFTFLLFFVFSLREELAFRAYPLRTLTYSIGSWKAQIIIAIIFALEHMVSGYTFAEAFIGSAVGAILFGIAALKTKGIALPVGLHMAWNFGQWCVGFKNEPGIWEFIVGNGSDLNYDIVGYSSYILVMGLAILGFYFYGRKKTTSQ